MREEREVDQKRPVEMAEHVRTALVLQPSRTLFVCPNACTVRPLATVHLRHTWMHAACLSLHSLCYLFFSIQKTIYIYIIDQFATNFYCKEK
jgi:hypothetical protein